MGLFVENVPNFFFNFLIIQGRNIFIDMVNEKKWKKEISFFRLKEAKFMGKCVKKFSAL